MLIGEETIRHHLCGGGWAFNGPSLPAELNQNSGLEEDEQQQHPRMVHG